MGVSKIWYGINGSRKFKTWKSQFNIAMCLSDANCKFEKKKVPMGLKHSSFVVAVDLFIEDPTWKVVVATTHLRCDVRTGFLRPTGGWNACRFVETQFLLENLVFLWISPQTKSAFSCVSIFQFSLSKNCESECHWCFFKTKNGFLLPLGVLPQCSPAGELLIFSISRITTKTFNGCHCCWEKKYISTYTTDLAKILLFSGYLIVPVQSM